MPIYEEKWRLRLEAEYQQRLEQYRQEVKDRKLLREGRKARARQSKIQDGRRASLLIGKTPRSLQRHMTTAIGKKLQVTFSSFSAAAGRGKPERNAEGKPVVAIKRSADNLDGLQLPTSPKRKQLNKAFTTDAADVP